MQRGAEALGWSLRDHHPQHRRVALRARRARATSASATRPGPSSPRRRPTCRRARARRRGVRCAPPPSGCSREGGRAAGVEAHYADPGSGRQRARHRARAARRGGRAARSSRRRCCCARGIGGPAVGDNLRLHPCTAVFGQLRARTSAPGGARRTPGWSTSSPTSRTATASCIEAAQYAPGTGGVGAALHGRRSAQALMSELPLRRDASSGWCATTAAAG